MKKFFLIVPIRLLLIIFVCYVGFKYFSYSEYKYECDYTPNEIESLYGIKLSTTSGIYKEHKQVLIIVGDSTNLNEHNLINRFADGAKEVGGEVEILYLCDYGIPYYDSGEIYWENYSQLDVSIDTDSIIDKMIKADIIVFEETIPYLGVEWFSDGRLGYLHHRYENSELKIQDKEFFYLTMSQSKECLSWFLCICRGFVMDTINAIERGYTYNPQQAYELGKSI